MWKMMPSPDESFKMTISDSFINKLFEPLPNDMDVVLQAHGSHTPGMHYVCTMF